MKYLPRYVRWLALAGSAALFCLALLPVLSGSRAAAASDTYYVATNGSDANPGTAANPFHSIAYALTRLSPGDTLLVRGGTYAERVLNPTLHPATSSARVQVRAYQGERPVV